MRWWSATSVLAAVVAAVVSLAATDEPRRRRGLLQDRGLKPLVGLDVSRARENGLEPVVQFLTFLQDRRGDPSQLLFVRDEDIEELAAESGEPSDEFRERLDQLGVLVSAN